MPLRSLPPRRRGRGILAVIALTLPLIGAFPALALGETAFRLPRQAFARQTLEAGDRQDLEHLPKSCRTLSHWQEKCRLDGCDVRKIEEWRDRCKADSIKQH